MALSNIFSAMKKQGYIVKDLDLYLLSLNDDTDNDRAIDVNAPSQIGKCLRSRYYARTQVQADCNAVDARTRRIFDNGTGVHVRLQDYLKKQGMLLMDEVPVCNEEYNIQGHTDGVLKLSDTERGIIEIKSINSRSFSALKAPKDEHRLQGLTYIFCLEQRRQEVQEEYSTFEDFKADKPNRMKRYAFLYQHLKSGHKHSRKEKIEFQCSLHDFSDTLLYQTGVPITKTVFLYENKDTQELKEYTVSSAEAESKVLLKSVLEDCSYLNDCVEQGNVPPRCEECTSKSCNQARWCDFKDTCWVV